MTTSTAFERVVLSEKKRTSSPICESCGKEFSNVHTLNCHRKQVHEGIKNFQCSICSAKFTTRYKTMRHFQAVHSELRNYTCDYEQCGSTFKTSDMLSKHQRIHFPGPYKCDACLEVFKYKSGWDYHVQKKHRDSGLKTVTIYKCSECPREFKTSAAYENHKKLQHPVPSQPFQPKELNPKSRRQQVKVVKSSEAEFECHYCHKRYKSKANFIVHLASHENEEEMQDYDFIIKEPETQVELDETEQHLEEEEEEVHESLDEFAGDNLLKGVDEDLVTIFKFETERFVDGPESFSNTELDNELIAKETTGEIEGEMYLYDDGADYMDDEEQLEETVEVEHEYIEYLTTDDIDQTTILNETRNMKPRKSTPNANNTGICDECGKYFKHSHHLKRHIMRKHQTDSKKLECDFCGAKFLLSYDLKRHMIKHSTKRAFKCNLCENAFKTASYLKNHVEAVHTEKTEKKFQCKMCERSYVHERHLVYHMRKHTNDLRFSCDLCDPPQLFHYSDAVKWHKVRHHGQPAPFSCTICTKRFIHEKSLTTHMKAHQENGTLAVNCPICGKSISEKRHLKRHIRTHDNHKFHCPCGFSFKERHQLTKHAKTCQFEWEGDIEEFVYEAVDAV